jgi:hypothetical protein
MNQKSALVSALYSVCKSTKIVSGPKNKKSDNQTHDDFFGDLSGSLVRHQPLLHLGHVHHRRLSTVGDRRHDNAPEKS